MIIPIPTSPLLQDQALATLPVLAVDCQSTAANPTQGHLLEIGWAPLRASDDSDTSYPANETHLVQLPPEVRIPHHVRRITGIEPELLAQAIAPEKAWTKLRAAALEIAQRSYLTKCPTVIHYARFEIPFLEDLHRRFASHTPFDLDIICSHAIVKRLFPTLPRKGLRAMAGYWGQPVPRWRRCTHHLSATCIIWRQILDTLQRNHNVQTVRDLAAWFKQTNGNHNNRRQYPMPRHAYAGLPEAPGIYRMRCSNGDVLYVGKACSLKQRVSSYFHPGRRHPEHILEMLTQAATVDVTETPSALEAALREADEIKQRCPPYNQALQKHNRKIGFASLDLHHHHLKPDATFRIGPLPAPDKLSPPAALLRYIMTDDASLPTAEMISFMLTIPLSHIPACDHFYEGIRLFRTKHKGMGKSKTPVQFLMRLGAALWRERLTTRYAAPDTSSEGGSSLRSPPAPQWLPEKVMQTIEAILRQGAHLVRKGSWLCLLSDSTLIWRGREKGEPPYHRLVLKAGVSHFGGVSHLRATPLSPPNMAISWHQRRAAFNVATYDRLRVLTTELRRLSSENREVHLLLGTGRELTTRRLTQKLKWI